MTFIQSISRFAGLSSDKRLTLLDLLALKRQRDQLSRLDQHMLTDLGLTEEDVTNELKRSFWEAPAGWRN